MKKQSIYFLVIIILLVQTSCQQNNEEEDFFNNQITLLENNPRLYLSKIDSTQVTNLRYYRNIVFSIKIKGDKTTPGADLGDNDFVGKPEIVSCEAIVYTKDGDGWIGAKIEKK